MIQATIEQSINGHGYARGRAQNGKSLPARIVGILRTRIHTGEYEHGRWLPSERDLMEELGVDRRTIRSAIVELRSEGLLAQRPHCRPLVTTPAAKLEARKNVSTRPVLPMSRVIALVMWQSDVTDRQASIHQRVFWGMNETLGVAGYHTVFLGLGPNTKLSRNSYDRESEIFRYIQAAGFGGIVFLPQAYSTDLDLVREVASNIPLVVLDRMIPGVQADLVSSDNRRSGCTAAGHLIRAGHKRIAYVTSGEYMHALQERLYGYLQAINQSLPEAPYELVLTPPLAGGNSWPAFEAITRLPPEMRPTAMICDSSEEALRVEAHLATYNLALPHDVTLVVFDNMQHGIINSKSLTTVLQPYEAIGREAAKLVLRRIHDPDAKFVRVELPPALTAAEPTTT